MAFTKEDASNLQFTGSSSFAGGGSIQNFIYKGQPHSVQIPRDADSNQLIADYINNLEAGKTSPRFIPMSRTGVDPSAVSQDVRGGGFTPTPAGGNIVDVASQALQQMYNQGVTINPNVQITPEAAAEFMSHLQNNLDVFLPFAQKETAQFYKDQFKLAKEDFLRSAGFTAEQIGLHEEASQRNYAEQLRRIGGVAAETGSALSGQRQLQERQLAEATQRDIDLTRRQASFQEGTLARQFAGQFGTANVPQVQIPTAPRVLPGEEQFVAGQGQTPFYELSPEVYGGLTGQKQFEQRAVDLSRAAQLESAFRQQQALNLQRQITL